MRLRYRVLLEKGLKMMEHTVMLGDRTGEASVWIERARDAKREIEQVLRETKESLAKLPYSEKELQKAFDDFGEAVERAKNGVRPQGRGRAAE